MARPSTSSGFHVLAAAFLAAPFLAGCSTLGYLAQAAKGQLELANRARPIDEVLKDEKTPPRVKRLLAEIPGVKRFGEELGLKPTRNYTEYTRLDRSAAIYVVSACDPLKFEPRKWGFPIVGSFTYLGWFSPESAKSHAEELKAEGLDVDLRGAQAYSTLGWFRDSVLSTMIGKGDEAYGGLVNVVIHESVHATFYLNGQSTFNESLASFVADRLTPLYIQRALGKDAPELKSYLESESKGEEKMKAFHEAYIKLKALYESGLANEAKLEEKKRVLTELRERFKFQREINNATLYQYRTYEAGGPEFEALFKACGESWPRFWAALEPFRKDDSPLGGPHSNELGGALKDAARKHCSGSG